MARDDDIRKGIADELRRHKWRCQCTKVPRHRRMEDTMVKIGSCERDVPPRYAYKIELSGRIVVTVSSTRDHRRKQILRFEETEDYRRMATCMIAAARHLRPHA